MAICANTYKIELPTCMEKLIIMPEAGLLAETNYKVHITDKFGNKYQVTVESDSNGFIEIMISEFPQHIFNQYAGAFTIEIFEADDYSCSPLALTFCDEEYVAISMSFFKLTTEDEIVAAIKCCDASGGGDSALCNRIYSVYFNTVIGQLPYTQPSLQGKEIVMIQYGTQTLEPSQYTLVDDVLTFVYPPDQVLRTVVFYKNICA